MVWLRLQGNQITEVPSNPFSSLRNLKQLYLHGNKIKILNSGNFNGLQNLDILYLYGNEISDLPAGIFAPLNSLQELALSFNKLSTIHSDSFGIHNKLFKIWFNYNKINAIDEKFIDNTAVSTLNMTNNICSQYLFTNRDQIKPYLRTCFDNYQPRSQQSYNQPSRFNQGSKVRGVCGKSKIGRGNIIGGTQINNGDFPW